MKFLVSAEQRNDSGIYIIRNSVHEKVYVGSAVNLRKRHSVHVAELKSGRHHSARLSNFVGKHGVDSLSFELLITCLPSQLITTEQIFINSYKSANPKLGFNISPSAGSTLGFRWSDEARAKMSLARKGNKLGPKTPESAAKSAAAHTGMKRSDESKAKMSAAQKAGYIARGGISDEIRAKMSASRMGRKMSEATKLKLIETWTGRKHRPESIEKMRASSTGKVFPKRSEESKAEMSEKTRQWWAAKRASDPEYTRKKNLFPTAAPAA